MGYFSWTKADKLRPTDVLNIVIREPYKFLIPKEFGGGFIKAHYDGFGTLSGDYNNKHIVCDMYELLAFWNADHIMDDGITVREKLEYDGEFPLMKEEDRYTDENRLYGIEIGCYDDQIDMLKFPLKLVSDSYSGTYEDCEWRSYGDPAQGLGPLLIDDPDCPEAIQEKYLC